MTLCTWLHTKRTPKSCSSWGFFLGYLSDFMCLSNHLLTQSPTKRATTVTTNDIMYAQHLSVWRCSVRCGLLLWSAEVHTFYLFFLNILENSEHRFDDASSTICSSE